LRPAVLELERGQGVVGRDVALSPMLDVPRIGTRYEAGVLRITIPLATAVRARAVEPARPLGGRPRSGTPGRGVLG
jgi:hypothetical protein